MKSEKSYKQFKPILLIVALGLALSSLGLVDCHRHSCGYRHNPEKIKKMALFKINDALDDLEATDAQRQQVVALAEELFQEGLKMHQGSHERMASILAEFEKDQPDWIVLHDFFDERLDAWRTFGHSAIEKLAKAYNILDSKQQAELLTHFKEHMPKGKKD